MEQTFNLPSIAELKKLNAQQLKLIFFELEKHRSSQLLDASDEYTERVARINKDYDICFKTLSDIVADMIKKSA